MYNSLLTACLKSRKRDDLAEKKLALLKSALEKWDFSTLRANHRELAGGQNNDVALVADDSGALFIEINGRSYSYPP